MDLSTLLGVVSAFAAVGLLIENRRLVRAQTKPRVLLYVSPDDDRATILELVAKNVGTAMAYDIRFQLSRDLPARAFGMNEKGTRPLELTSDGPLVDGIPALAPGEVRRITWGQYFGLQKHLGDEPVYATVRFTDGKSEMPSTSAVLEVASFVGTQAVQTNSTRVANALERIAKAHER